MFTKKTKKWLKWLTILPVLGGIMMLVSRLFEESVMLSLITGGIGILINAPGLFIHYYIGFIFEIYGYAGIPFAVVSSWVVYTATFFIIRNIRNIFRSKELKMEVENG